MNYRIVKAKLIYLAFLGRYMEGYWAWPGGLEGEGRRQTEVLCLPGMSEFQWVNRTSSSTVH